MKKIVLLIINLFCVIGIMAQSDYATKLFEFLPAPGQFVNTTWATDSTTGENVVGSSSSGVTLGGWGGYIILGFDKAIVDNDYNPYGIDFSVAGNAFSGWGEPAAVQVMQDVNENGLPDDTWYELAGSEYYFSTTIKNVEMTYYNPKYNSRYDIPFTTNKGFNGVMRTNAYHTQSYYPDPYGFDISADSVTYSGNYIRFCLDKSNPSYIEASRLPAFGYADVWTKNSNPTVPREAYDGFDLKWAVDSEGNYVDLDSVHFIRVYAASQEDGGWLGEVSPEIFNAAITEPDSSITITDNELNLIGAGQYQVLKGTQVQFEGILFNNGIPETGTSPVWTSSDESVATIDENGLLTALENGETTISFTGKEGVEESTQLVEVVELTEVEISLEGYSSTVSNDTLTVIKGETVYINAECIDNRSGSRNRYTYETFNWTSSDESTGTIDDGIFKALNTGSTKVIAQSTSNTELSDTIVVIVDDVPDVVPVETPVVIAIETSSVTYTNDEIFSTGTDATVYINSFDYTPGLITSIELENNELTVEISQEDWGTQQVVFNVTAYGIEQEVTVTFEISKPEELKNILFVNGGEFQSMSSPTQLYSYTPYNNKSTQIDDYVAGATSVQDMVVDGNYAFVSADYYITRYDINSEEAVDSIYTQDLTDSTDAGGTDGAGVNNKMEIYQNMLLVTRQNSSSAPEDGYNVRIYNKGDFSLITKIPVSNQATDIVVVGDTAYAMINGGFAGTTSSLAVIDLKTLTLNREIDLGESGLGVMQMLVKDDDIYCVRQADFMSRYNSGIVVYNINSGEISEFEYDAETSYDSSPLGIEPMTGDTLFVKKDLGYVTFNTSTNEFGSDIYFPIPERQVQDVNYNGKGSVYDTTEKRYYIAYNYWIGSSGAGQIYDSNLDSIGIFEDVGPSPEVVKICNLLSSNNEPYVYKGGKSASVYAGNDFTIELPTKIFRDSEDGYLSSYLFNPKEFDWLDFDFETQILTGNYAQDIESDTIIAIVLQAFDENGAYVTDTFELTVLKDAEPVVSEPIADITVKETADDLSIDISTLFTDEDNDDEDIELSVAANSDNSVVGISLSNDTLLLDFISVGVSTFVIQGVSNEKVITDTVIVTVIEDLSPVVANPIADISGTEYYENKIIDISNVFTDEDDEDDSITVSLLSNSDYSVADVTLSGTELTIDFLTIGTTTFILEAESNNLTCYDTVNITITDNVYPVVSEPLDAVIAKYTANDSVIDISSVFTDEDDDDELITKTILSNSNSDIVTATISGNELTLDFLDVGSSTIVIEAVSNYMTVTTSFEVIVINDTAPEIANPIADVSVNMNAEDYIIDLSDVFTDVDDDDSKIAKTVKSCSNENLVSVSITDNELTLSFVSDKSGIADVAITGETGGLTVTDIFSVTVLESTSVEFAGADDFIIYPNPSNGLFRLDGFDGDFTMDVTILGLRGEIVYKNNLYMSGQEIDISALPEGNYILKATCGQSVVNKRLILK